MRVRTLISGFLFAVLLASGWGSVLAATLCPHMARDHSCCHAMRMSDQGDATDQAMGDMQMAMPASESVTADENTESLGQPVEECPHCLSHSDLPITPAFVLSATELQSKRNANVPAPQCATSFASQPSFFVASVPARQNAPPAASPPVYVLVSVFRI